MKISMDKMKSNLFLIISVATISFSFGQTLKIQDLLDYSQIDDPGDFREMLAHKGFTFSKTYGNPETDIYLSEIRYEASSKEALLRPNSVTLSENNGIQEIGFTTVDKLHYVSLLEELKSESLQFVAQETKKHSFRDGILTLYTSKVIPQIEIEVFNGIVHEYADGTSAKDWRRYEFKVVNGEKLKDFPK